MCSQYCSEFKMTLSVSSSDYYYWTVSWASTVLLAGICCLSASSVGVCNAADGGPAGCQVHGRLACRPHRQSGGRHCTVGQYGYVPLGRHLVLLFLLLLLLLLLPVLLSTPLQQSQLVSSLLHHYIYRYKRTSDHLALAEC